LSPRQQTQQTVENGKRTGISANKKARVCTFVRVRAAVVIDHLVFKFWIIQLRIEKLTVSIYMTQIKWACVEQWRFGFGWCERGTL